ncbi:hypothetical protein H4582DRAFT_2075109 [Lactarius indigo]|nr:hypothetical protein H4582DRAFT_2088308 [Lactarius indigo]KAI9439735.1 hypothetical protein H4582DRAFT_2075109 [Lactarius indigo]
MLSQDEAVSTVFQNLGDGYRGLYNASGRGFPDISARGLIYTFVDHLSRKIEWGGRNKLRTTRCGSHHLAAPMTSGADCTTMLAGA